MKYKYLTLAIMLIFFFKHFTIAQITSIKDVDPIDVSDKAEINASNLSFNVTLGSGLYSSENIGQMLSFYTLPEVKYRLSPKLSIKAGVLFINSNLKSSGYLNETSKSFNRTYMSAGVDYTRERLSISGEILYGMNKSPFSISGNRIKPEYYLRLSSEYKITENLSIGLQIVTQNMNGFYRDPFSDRMYKPYGAERYLIGY